MRGEASAHFPVNEGGVYKLLKNGHGSFSGTETFFKSLIQELERPADQGVRGGEPETG